MCLDDFGLEETSKAELTPLSEYETEDDAATPPSPPPFAVQSLAGVCDPLGFFDPVGFSRDASEGKIKFYREVELKHGRVSSVPCAH